MKICHVIGTLRIGGAEKQFVHQVNELARRGHQVTAVVLSDLADLSLAELLNETIKLHHVPMRLRHLPSSLFRLGRLLRGLDLDVVHSHMYWASLYVALVLRCTNAKVFVTSEHGMNLWKGRVARLLERYLISPQAYKRICVSEEIRTRRAFEGEISEKKLVVVPNGVLLSKYKRREWSAAGNVQLLSIGRLIEAKDYETLLRAFKKVGRVDASLSILGEGDMRKSLAVLINKLELQSNVFLRGSQPDPLGWLYRSDIFVMSSKREGLPMALLEAMSTGSPIISTDVGGIKHMIADGISGRLVASGDSDGLANAIETLIDDVEYANKLGLGAHEKIATSYSIETIVERVTDIYAEGMS